MSYFVTGINYICSKPTKMPRNTNIDELLFEVKALPVYVQGSKAPVPGFKAITGFLNEGKYDEPTVFSIVSPGYRLLTNKDALELGKKLHRKLFPGATSDSFVVFNIIAPLTRSFCHIDIIDRNYEVNIWKEEVYLPFIRIQNSYNRFSALRFDLGFCRKLCDNGVIFQQNTISLEYNHTRELNKIEAAMAELEKGHLDGMIDDFRQKIAFSTTLAMPRAFFLPTAAFVFTKKFDIRNPDPYKKWTAWNKVKEFADVIGDMTDNYIDQFGETAYAMYNVLTDYASNIKHPAVTVNSYNWRCGFWLKTLQHNASEPNFSWNNDLYEYQFMLPEELRTAPAPIEFDTQGVPF